MVKAIEKHWKGCTISNLNKYITYTKQIRGFLDENTQYAKDWENNDIAKITNNIQHAAQFWKELLHTSGGLLEISQCYMTIMA